PPPTQTSTLSLHDALPISTAAAANTPSAQTLSSPQGLAVDPAYNLYVADSGANRVLTYPNTNMAPPAGLPASIVLGQTTFDVGADRKSTRLNSSHLVISYA